MLQEQDELPCPRLAVPLSLGWIWPRGSGGCDLLDFGLAPPCGLIAVTMNPAMSPGTASNGELVANLAPERTAFGEAAGHANASPARPRRCIMGTMLKSGFGQKCVMREEDHDDETTRLACWAAPAWRRARQPSRSLEAKAQTTSSSIRWDREADVVVIGSGASGLPAAIVAREAGSSVIVVEAQNHTGGHAICSGGNVPLGGGTSYQKKWGIADSPDLVFQDLTDWSVVEPNGFPDYRFNDREVIRAFADNCAATYEFLVAHGVVFVDKAPDTLGGSSVGNSVPREMHAAPMDWPLIQTGKPAAPDQAHHHVHRQRPHASARRGGKKGGR